MQLTGSYKDRTKFRLAETYLLLAEAYLRQNMPDKAADAVNEVRRRAKVADVSDDEMTMDYLLDERIRELYGEESRRFTLVRTGKLIERVKKYNPEARDLIQDFHVLWPIPQAVRDANAGRIPAEPRLRRIRRLITGPTGFRPRLRANQEKQCVRTASGPYQQTRKKQL